MVAEYAHLALDVKISRSLGVGKASCHIHDVIEIVI